MIDTGFNLEIGGVEMMDWKDNGWAMQIVCFHQLVFLMAFFYFVYTLTLTDISRSYLSLLGTIRNTIPHLTYVMTPFLTLNIFHGYHTIHLISVFFIFS